MVQRSTLRRRYIIFYSRNGSAKNSHLKKDNEITIDFDRIFHLRVASIEKEQRFLCSQTTFIKD